MEEEKKTNSEQEIANDLKELVVARLELLSGDKRISVGSLSGEGFTKQELIERVRQGDEIGRKVIELELTYLRALKDGVLLEEILSSDR